jgi:PhnB protein
MKGKVKAIPEGFHTLTPALTVRDAAQAIGFYREAFGARIGRIFYGSDGKTIIHAEIEIGDSILMLSDAFWGDLAGGIVDPFGHRWSLATHIKDLSLEEIEEGSKAAFAKMS